MKKLVISMLSLLPAVALAQNPYGQYPMGMDQADMQGMMQQMQKAQACMEKIDQSELQALETRAKKFEAEMRSLCASGDRAKAQEKAMTYSKEIMNHAAVQEARRCGEMMQGAMKGMMPDMSVMDEEKDYTSMHVCDAY